VPIAVRNILTTLTTLGSHLPVFATCPTHSIVAVRFATRRGHTAEPGDPIKL